MAISLAAREMLLDVSFPSGGAGRGDILILFDSSSGYYAWKFARLLASERTAMLAEDFRSHSKAYVASDRLVVFTAYAPMIFVRESAQRAPDLEAAEASALREATNILADIEAGRPRDLKISLSKLGPEFFAPALSAGPGLITLAGVSREDGKWELTVEGQWREKVTLNDRYEVTGMARMADKDR
jgi:hypothetical protein